MTDMDKMMMDAIVAELERQGVAYGQIGIAQLAEALTRAYNPDDSREELKHDLKRQMTIANIECNEVERLREALELARPFVFDRFQMANGAGYANTANTLSDILGKIDAALSPLPQGDT